MKVGLSIGGGISAMEHLEPRELAADGFRSIFLACYEDEMRWHAQTAADFSRACQAAGLEVYAVPLGYGLVNDPDPSTPSLYVREHPHNCQMDSRGRRTHKACPNNPSFLEWFSSNMRTLAWLMECRGFLWDEPALYHSRGAWACRCTWCQRLFFAQYQQQMPLEITDEVARFRRGTLLMFLLAAAAAIQAVDRRLLSVAMPTSSASSREAGIAADALGPVASASGVDALSVYVPWQSQGRDMEVALRTAIADALTATRAQRKETIIWIGGSPHPRDRLLDALQVAWRAGVQHLVIAGHQTLMASAAYERFRPSLTRMIERAR
ncbi:MAG: hypothetical protein AB7Y46_08115 [Armatimonadota bacterium]